MPWLGNTLALTRDGYHNTFERWVEEYGPIYRVSMPGRKAVVVSDRDAIKTVLRSRPHAFRRMSSIQPVLDEIGLDGLFSSEGERWKVQRKLVQAAFAPKVVRAAFPRIKTVTERLLALWRGVAARGQAHDIGADLMRFTIDVTAIIAFGEDVNSLEKGPDEFRKHLEHVFPVAFARMFLPVPYWRLVKLPRDRAMERGLEVVRGKVFAYIERARQALKAEPERADNPTNMLEALLAARDEDDPTLRLSDEEIWANAMGILLAGEDTTAHTITWMLHHVAADPQVQRRWQAEADTALGEARTMPGLEVAPKLGYIAGAVNETLRLRPPGPFLMMEAVGEQEVHGVRVPAGTAVILMVRSAATDPAAFTGPRLFDPGRWLASDAPAHHEPGASMPFGFGPRICPGRSLGLLEASSVGAMVARNFDLDPVGGGAVEERFHFTMAPEGVRLRLRLRP